MTVLDESNQLLTSYCLFLYSLSMYVRAAAAAAYLKTLMKVCKVGGLP